MVIAIFIEFTWFMSYLNNIFYIYIVLGCVVCEEPGIPLCFDSLAYSLYVPTLSVPMSVCECLYVSF